MTHLTDWQRGYQAGIVQGRTRAVIAEGDRLLRELAIIIVASLGGTLLLIAVDQPWIAGILGTITVAYGYLRWMVAQKVKALHTYIQEDL